MYRTHAARASKPPSLTNREREILALLAQGLRGSEVAVRLDVSSETVKTHIRNARGKLGARTRIQAVVIALDAGLLAEPQGVVKATPVAVPTRRSPYGRTPLAPAR
jgi:DNA-binding CsgD family transcriptional regulator